MMSWLAMGWNGMEVMMEWDGGAVSHVLPKTEIVDRRDSLTAAAAGAPDNEGAITPVQPKPVDGFSP